MQDTIQNRLKEIHDRIAQAAFRVGRNPSEIQVVAAAKTADSEKVAEALEAGVEILGENYVQEAQRMQGCIDQPAKWHLIGRLQSNKAKQAVRLFNVIETVDREKILKDLQHYAAQENKKLDLLIQVNLAGETSKSGAEPQQVLSIIRAAAACENLRCIGLMTLPPFFDDPEGARPYFAELRRLKDKLQADVPTGVVLKDLSMGMSGDFEVAVEEGATWVRIGTALFGARYK